MASALSGPLPFYFFRKFRASPPTRFPRITQHLKNKDFLLHRDHVDWRDPNCSTPSACPCLPRTPPVGPKTLHSLGLHLQHQTQWLLQDPKLELGETLCWQLQRDSEVMHINSIRYKWHAFVIYTQWTTSYACVSNAQTSLHLTCMYLWNKM